MKLSIELIELEWEYIARCPELDVNCYGSNKTEAFRRLRSVIQFYIDSAKEFGLGVDNHTVISLEGERIHGHEPVQETCPQKTILIN